MDTIGKGSTRSARLIDSKGNVLGQERLGSSGANKMAEAYKKQKADTESRRKTNSEFLESRKATGKSASKSIGTMKKGGVVKKSATHKMPNGSMMKNSAMKTGGKMKKCDSCK